MSSKNKNIAELLAQLTLEEKAALCSGATKWLTKEVDRLEITEIVMSDGPHGLRYVVEENAFGAVSEQKSTCFPTASALAASWNKELIYQVGTALGKEARHLGVDILLGPGVNIKRSPLGGRNFEYFSEDPELAGSLAAEFVKGVQSVGIGTSLKHYACNNQEYKRFSVNAQVSERALREIYLAAFEKVVKTAAPWTVMAAYNRVNGQPATQNKHLLKEILREEWGFKGTLISDWGAIHDRVAALAAGLDLEMPGPSPVNDSKILTAVQSGQLQQNELDQAVSRILTLLVKVQLARQEAENMAADQAAEKLYEQNHQLALKAAEESIVLLKNENKLLPLNLNEIKQAAVIGQLAVKPRYQGAGSSQVTPSKLPTALAELEKAAAKSQTELLFQLGYQADQTDQRSAAQLKKAAVKAAEQAEIAIIFAGIPEEVESEGFDRQGLAMESDQVELIKAVAAVQKQTIVVLNNGAALELTPWLADVPAVIEAWLPGQAGAEAIVNILLGKINPSAKLAETFPVQEAHNPAQLNFPGVNSQLNYAEDIYVGYRYYEKKKIRPLFSFGHGLSYTDFEYSGLELPVQAAAEHGLTIKFKLQNTGQYSGKEIVQLYVGQQNPYFDRPVKELKAFTKVELAAGESKIIKFNLDYRDFAYFNPEQQKWLAESDTYQIIIASSAADLRLQGQVKLNSSAVAHLLDQEDPVVDWLAASLGKQALEDILNEEQLQFIQSEANSYVTERPLFRLDYLTENLITAPEIEEIYRHYQKLINKNKTLN